MLALILPEYLSLLIAGADAEKLGPRAILREIKLLRKILRTNACRRALGQLEIAPDSLIPWSRMASQPGGGLTHQSCLSILGGI
jgi:hypothetical protein